MNAVVFDIQRFSIDDGPGIRTVIFFKGCNMRCNWCHNPESLHPYAEIMFFAQKCIACGKCFEACEKNCHFLSGGKHFFDRSLCDNCGRCAAVCYADALTVAGKSMTVSEVAAEIKKELPLLRESGEYLLQLINDVLDVNKVESGNIELHPTVCEEEQLFSSIASMMKYQMEKKYLHV